MTQRQENGVLVVGTLAPTVGGIAAVIGDHADGLRRRGISLDVVNTGHARRPAPGRPSLTNLRSALEDTLRTYRVTRRTGYPLAAIHTVGSPLLPLLRALALVAAARAAGSVVVLHLHGFDIEATIGRGGVAYRSAMRLVGRMSACVVVLHAQVKHSLGDVLDSRKVKLVPNCVDCSSYAPAVISHGRMRFLFVGTVGRRKGVADLLDALERTAGGVACDIVGGPAEESGAFFEELRARAAGLIAEGRVTFLGELPRNVVRDHIRAACAFVLPSHAEGMPVAMLEAMACGLPVVVTPVGAMGELVARAGCGIVVPVGNPGELAAALDRLAADSGERRRLGEAGRRAVEREHCCDQVLDELATLYGSLTS